MSMKKSNDTIGNRTRGLPEQCLNQNLMKICPVGAELFHADGQTNKQKDEANSRF
jgi:hypothetical protein